ncbi:hypothetical protein L2725_22280 [Shewanella corallii]|uniref:DUF2188 domain-containing protein n=1 Tax=Shewanella corallii TaxID=560080 RepID=A0ABT0NDB2_9GAMM|nr:hypothetical protein [Shewanella corallii]MCL2916468.1 hypothetical protein [Shewanella corallii]
MHTQDSNEYEETLTNGWTIYIEPNPDSYRGGLMWHVCHDDCIWDSGIEWSLEYALSKARETAETRGFKEHSNPHVALLDDD